MKVTVGPVPDHIIKVPDGTIKVPGDVPEPPAPPEKGATTTTLRAA